MNKQINRKKIVIMELNEYFLISTKKKNMKVKFTCYAECGYCRFCA